MSRSDKIAHGPESGPGGADADRVDQLLGMIPAIYSVVGEIRRLLAGRQKDYYTVDEFAAIVCRAPYTIRGWVRDGRVAAIRVSGTGPRGRLLIPRAEVDKVIHAGQGQQVPADVTV